MLGLNVHALLLIGQQESRSRKYSSSKLPALGEPLGLGLAGNDCLMMPKRYSRCFAEVA